MEKKSFLQTFARQRLRRRLLAGVAVSALSVAAAAGATPYKPMGGDQPAAQAMRLKGTMEAWLKHPDGSTEYFRKDNLIVDVGFDFIADAIGKPTGRPGVMSYIAVGTGSTAASAADTTLETELIREAATYSHTAGTKVFQFDATFDAGVATGAITEAGVLNASTGGTLLDRVVFAVINKGADDILTQRFTFTMS